MIWVVTRCSLVGDYGPFGRTNRIYFKSLNSSASGQEPLAGFGKGNETWGPIGAGNFRTMRITINFSTRKNYSKYRLQRAYLHEITLQEDPDQLLSMGVTLMVEGVSFSQTVKIYHTTPCNNPENSCLFFSSSQEPQISRRTTVSSVNG